MAYCIHICNVYIRALFIGENEETAGRGGDGDRMANAGESTGAPRLHLPKRYNPNSFFVILNIFASHAFIFLESKVSMAEKSPVRRCTLRETLPLRVHLSRTHCYYPCRLHTQEWQKPYFKTLILITIVLIFFFHRRSRIDGQG